jgi:putative FmdB family regulatory protein
MPLYEYRCEECGEPFSLRRSINERDEDAVCPACAATKVVRLISSFAAFSHGDGASVVGLNTSACGGCSQTSCAGCGVKH